VTNFCSSLVIGLWQRRSCRFSTCREEHWLMWEMLVLTKLIKYFNKTCWASFAFFLVPNCTLNASETFIFESQQLFLLYFLILTLVSDNFNVRIFFCGKLWILYYNSSNFYKIERMIKHKNNRKYKWKIFFWKIPSRFPVIPVHFGFPFPVSRFLSDLPFSRFPSPVFKKSIWHTPGKD
jgi:hypothetical protein